MTHDELLAKINPDWDEYVDNSKFREALRAVVELHKDNGYGSCDICADPNTGHLGVMALYPCPTIQAAEKELK